MSATVTILTDIPVWVRPLVEALEALGNTVAVVDEAVADPAPGLIVNRVSTALTRRQPARARQVAERLAQWEAAGRRVINGARCHALGQSKIEQAALFASLGLQTPPTAPALPGSRAFPGQAVLLKPPAGGFGKGIRRLAPDEPAPADLDDGWVEQVVVTPADGAVHRIEAVGQTLLYDAASPLAPETFDYCLAHGGPEVTLETTIDPTTAAAVRRLFEAAGMELGAVEYLRQPDGSPCFIDLNPVSSLSPHAASVCGFDPHTFTASYLTNRAVNLGE